jgi:hypothetical protein
VFRWLEEGWEDVVGVCSEAEAVMRAVMADLVSRSLGRSLRSRLCSGQHIYIYIYIYIYICSSIYVKKHK